MADLPSDVLIEAKRVATRLSELEAAKKEDSASSRLALRRKAMLRVCSVFLAKIMLCTNLCAKLQNQLTQCLEYSELPDRELLAYIGRLQKDITQILRSGIAT